MKSKQKKILANILCMLMLLTNNFSKFSEETENPNAEPVVENKAPMAVEEVSETAAVEQPGTPEHKAIRKFVDTQGRDISSVLGVSDNTILIDGTRSQNLNTLGSHYSAKAENGYYCFSEAHLDSHSSNLIADEINIM